MKFKTTTIISVILYALIFTSCMDDFEYKEHTNYEGDYIKLNFQNVGGLITDIYAKIDYDFGKYDGAMMSSATDESVYAYESNPIHDFYNGSWSPANAKSSEWNNSYSAIQQCNLFLEEFLGLTFPELKFNDDYQAQMFRYRNYENEARFLRSYFYFNLVRQYGDVPFYTHVLSSDEVNTLDRTSYSEIINFIVDECDDIVNKIPADYTDLKSDALSGNIEDGRVNRLAVLGLKAQALMYASSPLFNLDNDADLWHKSALANKAVLDSCAKYGYELVDYSKIWGTENWRSKEAFFVRRIDNSGSNNLESRNFPIGVEGGNSGNCPTQDLVDAYEMKETGKLWNEPGSGYSLENIYSGRDPRFYLTIATNGEQKWPFYNLLPLQTYFGGANGEPISGATPTSYYLKKLLDGTIDLRPNSTTRSRHSWVKYRLGEFYLNYAESVFKHLGSADTKNNEFPMSAREAINTVRSRKGVEMPPIPEGLSNEDFWKKYTNERMIELAFEGHRFWDLRRWKEGEKLKSVTLMKITQNGDGSLNYIRTNQKRQWDDKMYFFPIPQSELLKNNNLTQNKGW